MAAHRKNPPPDILEIIERIVAGEGGSTKILARAIGVSDSLVRAWLDREDLRETYEAAREAHMHKLYLELLQMSRTGKGNVAGIIYTLKARFKQYDQPGSGKLVDVNVTQVNPVLVVRDHGDDASWQAKAIFQQRALIAECTSPQTIEAPLASHLLAISPEEAPTILPSALAPQAAPVPTVRPSFAPPGGDWLPHPVSAAKYAPGAYPSAPAWRPVAPVQAPVWRAKT